MASGVVACERSELAQYIHLTVANSPRYALWLEEFRVYSEMEIGQFVTKVNPEGQWDNDPMLCTLGDVRPENVSTVTTFN